MKRNVVLFLVGATLVGTAAYGQLRKWNEKMQGLGKTFSDSCRSSWAAEVAAPSQAR